MVTARKEEAEGAEMDEMDTRILRPHTDTDKGVTSIWPRDCRDLNDLANIL